MQEPSGSRSARPVTVIVPAFNEAEALQSTLPPVLEHCHRLGWRLVVVDDGSTDGTWEVLRHHAGSTDVHVLRHKRNRGYGAAVKSGIRHAKTELVATIDADGQHRPADLEALYDLCVRVDADMVVGDRGRKGASAYRSLGKRILRGIAALLVSLPVRDLNSGMKLYRTDLARRYLPLCPDSMAYSDVIVLAFLSDKHLVVEHPVTVDRRSTGRSSVTTRTAFETLMSILTIITLFNPLRVFLPLATASFVAGVLWGAPIVFLGRGVSVGSMLGITTGLILFGLGLIAEQLAQIRKSAVLEASDS